MAVQDKEHQTQITIYRGSVYIDAAIYERYFLGLESVILLRRENDLVVLPVRHAAAGGYLLKLRNAHGDRVVNAPDFFSSNGIDATCTREVDVQWSADLAGLKGANLFESEN